MKRTASPAAASTKKNNIQCTSLVEWWRRSLTPRIETNSQIQTEDSLKHGGFDMTFAKYAQVYSTTVFIIKGASHER
jgi:hypothetical protein